GGGEGAASSAPGPRFAETCERPDPVVAENTMVSSAPQLPPRPTGASHNVMGAPPEVETFLSWPSAKKAIHRLSGEKNGVVAFRVPAMALASTALVGRRNNSIGPPPRDATYASNEPSDEIATAGKARPLNRSLEDSGPTKWPGAWIEAVAGVLTRVAITAPATAPITKTPKKA